jgi:propionyl-CoA carboxylase alpha chain
MFYDPMIAKLVTWGETRDEAADLQIAALDAFEIEGLGHNIDFVSAIMQHPRFRAGELTTGFIAEEYPEGFAGAPADEERLRVIAAIAGAWRSPKWGTRGGLRGSSTGRRRSLRDWIVRLDGHDFRVTLGDGHAMVDQHRIEGTCDWMPECGRPPPAGTARRSGSWSSGRGSTGGSPPTAARSARAPCPPGSRRSPRGCRRKVPPDLSRLLLSPMPGAARAAARARGRHGRARPAAGDGRGDEDGEHPARAARGTVKAVTATEGMTLAAMR